MSVLIDGKKLAANIRGEIREKVEQFESERGRQIGLAVVLVGEDPASQVYVRNKIKACEEVGIKSYAYYLDKDTAQARVEELIRSLSVDNKINGILVQLPLPAHLDSKKILELIPYAKDVDGFSAENMGRLSMNEPCLVACTPNGVMKMFESEKTMLCRPAGMPTRRILERSSFAIRSLPSSILISLLSRMRNIQTITALSTLDITVAMATPSTSRSPKPGEGTSGSKDWAFSPLKAITRHGGSSSPKGSRSIRPGLRYIKMIKGKQVRYLRSLSNTIEQRYLFGKGEVDEAFIAQLDAALEAKELIKVGLLQNSSLSAEELAAVLTKRLNCELVQHIGRVLVLYRESKRHKRIVLP